MGSRTDPSATKYNKEASAWSMIMRDPSSEILECLEAFSDNGTIGGFFGPNDQVKPTFQQTLYLDLV